jgi:uncharacterized protein (TIGR01777 family)
VRVVLAGASGLIGTALRTSLREDGHQVLTLVRHPVSAADEHSWDPARGLLDPDVLRGADAVVCLSGAGVGDHRWTAAYKQQLVASRVDSVSTIARTVAGLGSPRLLITASAVGFYGDTGDEVVDERSPAGHSFLSDLCRKWERAAEPAVAAAIRVAHLRTGLVLSRDGGLLKRLQPIVRAGVAGKIGTGRQYLPWISLRDEVAAIRFVLEHEISGPVNLTGPAPVRNAEFMRALGEVLHRPTVLPAPALALKIVLGQFAEDVLTGQRALPAVLTSAGFTFEHTDVRSALRWALEG